MNSAELVAEIRKAVKEKKIELCYGYFGVSVHNNKWDFLYHLYTDKKVCCALSSLIVGEDQKHSTVLKEVVAKTNISENNLQRFIDGFDFVGHEGYVDPEYEDDFYLAGVNFSKEVWFQDES